jgi:hypothetical protein
VYQSSITHHIVAGSVARTITEPVTVHLELSRLTVHSPDQVHEVQDLSFAHFMHPNMNVDMETKHCAAVPHKVMQAALKQCHLVQTTLSDGIMSVTAPPSPASQTTTPVPGDLTDNTTNQLLGTTTSLPPTNTANHAKLRHTTHGAVAATTSNKLSTTLNIRKVPKTSVYTPKTDKDTATPTIIVESMNLDTSKHNIQPEVGNTCADVTYFGPARLHYLPSKLIIFYSEHDHMVCLLSILFFSKNNTSFLLI